MTDEPGRTREWWEVRVPFFEPLYRRVLAVACCFAWAATEAAHGSAGWGLAFAAAGGHLGWQFFVTWAGRPRP